MKPLPPNRLTRWIARVFFGVCYCPRCGQWTTSHHMRLSANGTAAGYWSLCSRPAQATTEEKK